MQALVHALVTGLLCGAAYWAAERSGLFEGRTRVGRALVYAPIVFVLVFVLNLIWPFPS